ncbi:unnamed protein product [Cylicocyclus nassatus]|uniref:Uncharacterized protein n=1 Tax=Cylicocyclus nassatus TaxID=53992 RepID=A0AA36GPB1_CYLNA|nr:unnamed protein product [Cylicocyclus nassatus]
MIFTMQQCNAIYDDQRRDLDKQDSRERNKSHKMDVVYDVVESIHLFIPLIAIAFVCGVLYFYNRKETQMQSPPKKGRTTTNATESKKDK